MGVLIFTAYLALSTFVLVHTVNIEKDDPRNYDKGGKFLQERGYVGAMLLFAYLSPILLPIGLVCDYFDKLSLIKQKHSARFIYDEEHDLMVPNPHYDGPLNDED